MVSGAVGAVEERQGGSGLRKKVKSVLFQYCSMFMAFGGSFTSAYPC